MLVRASGVGHEWWTVEFDGAALLTVHSPSPLINEVNVTVTPGDHTMDLIGHFTPILPEATEPWPGRLHLRTWIIDEKHASPWFGMEVTEHSPIWHKEISC